MFSSHIHACFLFTRFLQKLKVKLASFFAHFCYSVDDQVKSAEEQEAKEEEEEEKEEEEKRKGEDPGFFQT